MVFSLLAPSQNGYIYVGIIAGVILIIGNLLISGVFRHLSKGISILISLLLFVVPLAGYGGYEAYMNHIEIENAEVDLTAYEPYQEETKIAQLKERSDFQMMDNPPTLDGATALYPVYSAFVRAVYPEDSYPHK
ncbi:hypothetical protein ACE1TI_18590 [Alteribacillus sp. JSM 102045]|uniref:hypothetical protein n=1 Tax=Alteribacillus sp. JSM 102045 TaxID=1562101 RepID=UPI0035C0B996